MNIDRKCDVVVVTGGRGLIGTGLLPKLAAKDRTKCFDNLSRTSGAPEVANAEYVVGDVRRLDEITAATAGCDAIIHLAAFGSVVESVAEPWANFEQNVIGTLQVLLAARANGVRRVIMASTGGALIGEANPPVDESSLPKPISPYGASKLCGEAYLHAFAKAYGMETVALRFANVYGPWSAHKKGAITAFIKSIMRDEPITIYGDGKASRDFLYVDDICAGICLALEQPDIGGEVFHLASGVETTVIELADLIRNVAGRPNHPIHFAGRRPGEVSRNFARYDKAACVLGYRPSISLEEGLAKTFEWFRANEALAFAATAGDS